MVDRDGDILDIMVQSQRDKKAAKKFFRKLLKGLRYVPRVITEQTEKLLCREGRNVARCRALPAKVSKQPRREFSSVNQVARACAETIQVGLLLCLVRSWCTDFLGIHNSKVRVRPPLPFSSINSIAYAASLGGRRLATALLVTALAQIASICCEKFRGFRRFQRDSDRNVGLVSPRSQRGSPIYMRDKIIRPWEQYSHAFWTSESGID